MGGEEDTLSSKTRTECPYGKKTTIVDDFKRNECSARWNGRRGTGRCFVDTEKTRRLFPPVLRRRCIRLGSYRAVKRRFRSRLYALRDTLFFFFFIPTIVFHPTPDPLVTAARPTDRPRRRFYVFSHKGYRENKRPFVRGFFPGAEVYPPGG